MQNSMRTYARQTLLFGEDELTSLQAVSPASRFRSRANAKARRTTATSGRKCCGLFGLFDLDGSWARTFSELLIGRKEWSSSRCVLTWRRRDMRFNRTLYRLAVSALPTEGTDAGSSPILLKTPCAFDATTITPKKNPVPGNSGCLAQEVMCGYAARRGLLPTVQTQGLKQCENGKTVFMPLSLLPTPNASEGWKYTISYNPDSQNGRGLTALAMNGMLPTPRATKITGGDRADFSPSLPGLMLKGMLPTPTAGDYQSPGQHGEGGPDLRTVVSSPTGTTSQLNPRFVAEMMGFPVDWTVLPFLNGETCPSKPTETPSCLK